MATVLALLAFVGTIIWVGVDASKRDWRGITGSGGTSTTTWVVGCILLWIVVFPMYLVKRSKAPLKALTLTPAPPPAEAYRPCPHCKKAMRRDAELCPHCQQSSTPWQFHHGRWWYRGSEQTPWQWLDEPNGVWVAQA